MGKYRDYDDFGLSDTLGQILQLQIAQETLAQRKRESDEENQLARDKFNAEEGQRGANVRSLNAQAAYHEALTSDMKNLAEARKKLLETNIKISQTQADREIFGLSQDKVQAERAQQLWDKQLAAHDAYKKAVDKFATDTMWDSYLSSAGTLDAHASRAAMNRIIHNMTLHKQSRDIRRQDFSAAIMEGKLDEYRLSGASAEQAGRDYAELVLSSKGDIQPPATAMGSLLLRGGQDRLPYSKEYLTKVTNPNGAEALAFLDGQGKVANDVAAGKITVAEAKKLGPPGMPEEMVDMLLMDVTAVSETARELQAVLSGGQSARFDKAGAEKRVSEIKAGFLKGFAEGINTSMRTEVIPGGTRLTSGDLSSMGVSPQAAAASIGETPTYNIPDAIMAGNTLQEQKINAAVRGVRDLQDMDPASMLGTIGGSARARFHMISDHDPMYSQGAGMTYGVATETNRRILAGTALRSLSLGTQGDMVNAAEMAYKDQSMALSFYNMMTSPDAIKDFKEISSNGPGAAEAWHKWQPRIGMIQPETRTNLMKWVIGHASPEAAMAVTQEEKTAIYQSVQAATPAQSKLFEFDDSKGVVSRAASAIGLDIPDILEPPTIKGLSPEGQAAFQSPEQMLNTEDPVVRDIIYRSGYGSDYDDFRRFLSQQPVAATPGATEQSTEQPTEPGKRNVPRTGDIDPRDVNRYASPMVRSYMNNGNLDQMRKSMSKADLDFAASIRSSTNQLGITSPNLGTVGAVGDQGTRTGSVLGLTSPTGVE